MSKVKKASFLSRFSDGVYSKLKTSFTAGIFTSYRSGEKKSLYDTRLGKKLLRPMNSAISEKINESYSAHLLSKIAGRLVSLRLRAIGTFLAAFGIYTALIFLASGFLLSDKREVFDIFFGMAVAVSSVPFLFSDETLAHALNSSRLGRFLKKIAGLQIENAEKGKAIGRSNHGFVLGVIAGVCSYFISPTEVFLLILSAAAIWIIASRPEFGVILTSFMIPFAGTSVLAGIVAVTSFFFLVKFIRGKRYVAFESLDASMFGIMLVILLGGMVSVSSDSLSDAVLYAVLGLSYFLVSDLMRSKRWLERITFVLVMGYSFSSLVFVICTAAERLRPGFISDVSDLIKGSLLEGALTGKGLSSFVTVELVVLPLILSLMICPAFGKRRPGLFVSFLITLCPAVFLHSPYILAAMAAEVILFLLICSSKSIYIPIIGAALCPAVYFLIPAISEKAQRFLGHGFANFTDSRLTVWKNSAGIISKSFFGGIGFGGDSFSYVYPAFSSAGAEGVKNARSLYLQFWIETGVFGLIILAAFIVLLIASAFTVLDLLDRAKGSPSLRSYETKNPLTGNFYSYGKERKKDGGVISPEMFCRSRRVGIAASFCAVFGLLVFGVFDHIWAEPSVFLEFWMAAGLCAAHIRTVRGEIGDSEASYRSQSDPMMFSETDIRIR